MKKILFLAVGASLLSASGYKIPEQSTDSMGLLVTNIAKSFGADAAYYNPANMVDLENKFYLESMVNLFHIGSASFNSDFDGKKYNSKPYSTFGGTFHMVSPEYNNFRFGLSFAVPVGLRVEWGNAPSNLSRMFELRIYELNPTVAYQINDNFSVGLGLSLYHAKGRAHYEFYKFAPMGSIPTMDVKGSDTDFGYNLALKYKPTSDLALAITYKSAVNFKLRGHQTSQGFPNIPVSAQPQALPTFAQLLNYDGKAIAKGVLIPAQLIIAGAYDISKDTTILAAVERTFWSKFKGYDFDYPDKQPVHNNPLFNSSFDLPAHREFKDSNTYRIGLRHEFNNKISGMIGFAYDEAAAANPESISFELPDTRAFVYSFGLAYSPKSDLELGFGYIYQDRLRVKSNVEVVENDGRLRRESGNFGRFGVQIIGASVKYSF